VNPAAIASLLDAGKLNLRAEIDNLERTALTAALERAGGVPARAAELLGEVGRGQARDPGNTVRAMMRRHGIR
jgi:transcriptional regulator with GAF, ATPase, and Fis domain